MNTTDLVRSHPGSPGASVVELFTALLVTAAAGASVGRFGAVRSFLLSASNAGRVIPSLALARV